MDILRVIAAGIKEQKTNWRYSIGFIANTYNSLIDSISSFDSEYGVGKLINDTPSFPDSFRNKLINSITESTKDISAVDKYGFSALSKSSIIYAPTKECDSNMTNCFHYCINLIYVDYLDFSKVTNFNKLFQQCYSLKSINNSIKMKIKNTCTSLFQDCVSIEAIPLGIDLTEAVSTELILYYCHSISDLYDNVKLIPYESLNTRGFFNGCTKLRRLPRGFEFKRSTDTSSLFSGCTSLGSDDGKLDCTCVSRNLDAMFYTLSQNNNVNPITEITGLDLSYIKSTTANTLSSGNPLRVMFYNSKITRCIFNGNHNVEFDCLIYTQGWDNLDIESITSFIDNCLYDFSEDLTGTHIFRVSASMKAALENTNNEEWDMPYSDVLAVMGWDLQ